jgi:hypothetical protein
VVIYYLPGKPDLLGDVDHGCLWDVEELWYCDTFHQYVDLYNYHRSEMEGLIEGTVHVLQ